MLNRTSILIAASCISLVNSQWIENADAAMDSFRIQSFKNPRLCFDVANNRVTNGTPIQVADCKQIGHSAQSWIKGNRIPNYECADAEGGCLYEIKLKSNPKFCLDYRYSKRPPEDNVNLQIWQCRDSRNGNAAYWGFALAPNGQALSLFSGVPGVGIFTKLSPSISTDAREGQTIRMRDFKSPNIMKNHYQYWVTDYF